MAYVITDSCVACGTCLPVCPVEAISEGDIYHIDPDTCIECGSCAEVCPSEAIIPHGKRLKDAFPSGDRPFVFYMIFANFVAIKQ